MDMDPRLKQTLKVLGQVLQSVQIPDDFWDKKNPIWQNTNNHTVKTLRDYYWANETDEEFKQVLGPLLDKLAWCYVSFPEWRMRISWIVWFFQLYATDRQFLKEIGANPFTPEIWMDPRKWILASQVPNPVTVTLEQIEPKKEGEDDSAGGLATQASH